MPSNVLPLHLKQTYWPMIWIFTEDEGDGIESRLPFKIFSNLTFRKFNCRIEKNGIPPKIAVVLLAEANRVRSSRLSANWCKGLRRRLMRSKVGLGQYSPASMWGLESLLSLVVIGSLPSLVLWSAAPPEAPTRGLLVFPFPALLLCVLAVPAVLGWNAKRINYFSLFQKYVVIFKTYFGMSFYSQTVILFWKVLSFSKFGSFSKGVFIFKLWKVSGVSFFFFQKTQL